MSPVETSAVVRRVSPDTLHDPDPTPGSLLRAIQDDSQALLYFLVNVGDGDTQLIVLPPDEVHGVRRLIIVDVATTEKLPALIEALHEAQVINEELGAPGQVSLLVATHPHFDHIGGLPDLLERFHKHAGWIDQFWEPGYFFPGPSFHNLMRQLEDSHICQRRLQPTSGTTMYLDAVKITVMGPGVNLRTRFDTYGVGVNDASITLMVDYPAHAVYTEQDRANPDRRNRRELTRAGRRLLLGGDAQFTSWAQANIDFPDLVQLYNPVLAKELAAARGRDYLAADIFKLSHHASKHGINIELLERVGAQHALVSATAGGGRYNFPHLLAMEAAREARQASTTKQAERLSDHELGIHLTGALLDTAKAEPLGSVAIVVPRGVRAPLRIFRLMDGPKQDIDLEAAREVRVVRR